MDVGGWLRSLGLEQYEAVFRENAIDDTVLPDLTEEHLRDMGIPLGVRLKLLRAITTLPQRAAPLATSTEDAMPGSAPADVAERRQVTVMFADLVGSTALSTRMDPEDLREVVGAYHSCVAEVVRRFEGFVAQYLGDGVLIYFGYPQAHEDDAERAVRAAMEVTASVRGLKTLAALETRVGIATGLVVVGDLMDSGSPRERRIVGETPNLAARMQGLAQPNMVVIADSTRRLLGKLFELEDLGAKELKGIAEPVRAWAAVRESAVASRFEALHGEALSPLVGRGEEFELLLRRWSKTKSDEGQVVLLSGEAGIGKSRLTAALLESLAGEAHTRLRYFCSPQHTDSAFYPIIGQLERATGLTHDDAPHVKLDKLEALLAETGTPTQNLPLFAEILSLPNDGRYPIPELTPPQRRQKLMEALIAQLQVLTRAKPVLMIFEDAHWIDPTSLEVVGRIVDRLRTLRVLLIVTFRPEFEPPWIGRSYVTALTINRLTEREIGTMIDRIVDNRHLSASIRQDILERSDGIPLFVEEMTKAVLEAESMGGTDHGVATIPSPAIAVPASLHASLMTRLDRLGHAKEVAQIGAAIGREFSHALLAAVARKPDRDLRSALDRLIAAGLLFRQGMPPHATYLFKHALVQDAAYGTLLRQPRRALHARIADTLETQFIDVAEGRPELLARHYTDAGLIERAAGLWGKAGERSQARSALAEAAEQFKRALDQIATLTATTALRRQEIELQVALITPLIHVKGYAAPETKEATQRARVLIERAEAIGEPPEDPLLLFSILYSFWVVNFVAFNGEAIRELAGQFLSLGERQRKTVLRLNGHRLMGASLLLTGDIAAGRTHYDHALALYNPVEHRSLATRFGQDIRVTILSFRSLALWVLGFPDAALLDAECALNDAREIDHAATLMHGLNHGAMFAHMHCGNYMIARGALNELLALADEKGALFWKALGTLNKGCLLVLTGENADAVQLLTTGIAAYRATGATIHLPMHFSYLARAHAQLGQIDDAVRCIDEAMIAAKAGRQNWYDAEINRVAGEVMLRSPEADAEEAKVYFNRALSIARSQQAKSWELRAAMSMAQLWRNQGKQDEARNVLAPVYGWFTEGFETLDLKRARILLDELAVTMPAKGCAQ